MARAACHKAGGEIVLHENKPFEFRSTANAWLSQRDDRPGQPGALKAALKSTSSRNQAPALSDAIERCFNRRKRFRRIAVDAMNVDLVWKSEQDC
ncbi:hypothetical protein [Nitratireductor aquibiodomus]|nr:hypothetical protein [Nitratireductor aquibiodomus]